VSWLDFSFARDISKGGHQLLFAYSGQGSSPNYDVFVRGIRDSEASRLGEGQPQQFSPSGTSVLAVVHGPPSRLVVIPIGAGAPRAIETGNITVVHARWLPGETRMLVVGSEPGRGVRAYILEVEARDSRRLRPITPEFITFADQSARAPDGARVAFRSPEGTVMVYPTSDGVVKPAKGFAPDEMPMGWTSDGAALLLINQKRHTLLSVDPASGRRNVMRPVTPSDPALFGPTEVYLTPDGKSYAGNYGRRRDVLFVASGLR